MWKISTNEFLAMNHLTSWLFWMLELNVSNVSVEIPIEIQIYRNYLIFFFVQKYLGKYSE